MRSIMIKVYYRNGNYVNFSVHFGDVPDLVPVEDTIFFKSVVSQYSGRDIVSIEVREIKVA